MPRLAQPDGFRCGHICRTCGGRCVLEPHPINIMHKCEQDHAEPFDPTATADAFNSGLVEAEHSIYRMLCNDYPEMDDGERRKLAHKGALQSAQMRQGELDSGTETDIYCVCTHAQKGHVGGSGRCKDPSCDCETYTPDRIRFGAVQ